MERKIILQYKLFGEKTALNEVLRKERWHSTLVNKLKSIKLLHYPNITV